MKRSDVMLEMLKEMALVPCTTPGCNCQEYREGCRNNSIEALEALEGEEREKAALDAFTGMFESSVTMFLLEKSKERDEKALGLKNMKKMFSELEEGKPLVEVLKTWKDNL